MVFNASSAIFQPYHGDQFIDLLEAVTEAKIVIRRLTEESNDVHVWKALFDKGCEI
jgi:hypothetical protein